MKQTFIKSAMLLLLILSMATTRAQEVALKTNLLGWASTSANAKHRNRHGQENNLPTLRHPEPLEVLGRQEDEILECYARIQMVHLPEVWRSFLRNSCLRR